MSCSREKHFCEIKNGSYQLLDKLPSLSSFNRSCRSTLNQRIQIKTCPSHLAMSFSVSCPTSISEETQARQNLAAPVFLLSFSEENNFLFPGLSDQSVNFEIVI